jgi:hypothetical protein
MPKAVVYVRAEDARAIEAIESVAIADWVRERVAEALEAWKSERVRQEEEETLWKE